MADIAAGNGYAPEEEERKRRRRDPIGWFDWLRSLFGGPEEVIIGVAALAFSVGVTAVTIRDAYSSYVRYKPGKVAVDTTKWADNTTVYPIEGFDSQGRRALFDFVVMHKDYGWVRGSTTELSKGSRKLPATEIATDVFSAKTRDGLTVAREVIAVGLASQEGDVAEETHRAGLRARQSANWVKAVVGDGIPVSALNLGRYIDPCATCETGDTSWQRPYIIVAVREAEAGTNISEALAVAMSEKSNLPSPNSYSAFALTKVQ